MLLCIIRHAFEDVWVGLMKHSNSSVWYGAKSSEWVEQTITLHGQLLLIPVMIENLDLYV